MLRWSPSWADLASDLASKPVGRPAVLSRLSTPRRGPLFWATPWLLAAAAEFVALIPVLFPEQPVVASDLVSRLIGGSFAVCGLIAWRRRPDSRAGLLMLGTGVGFFLYPLLSQIDVPAVQTLALLSTDWWTVAFIPLILGYLYGGRMQGRVDWLLLAAFAFPLVLLQFVWMLFWETEGNVLAILPSEPIENVIDKAQRGLCAVAALATAAVLAVRWRAASKPRRRAMLPSLAGCLAMLLFSSLLVNDLVTGTRSETLLWLALSSIITVPAAFLIGQLRSRLARHGLADLLLELRNMHGEALQRALGRAIGDQSLKVAYAVPGGTAYVGAAGEPFTFPEPGGERAVTPVERDGREVAALVPTAVSCELPERLPEPVELAAYFVASESLANVAKYAGATKALVSVARSDGVAVIQIADDGVGGADEAAGSGLRGLSDRVEALEGRLYVTSPPGEGTVVTAEVPVASGA